MKTKARQTKSFQASLSTFSNLLTVSSVNILSSKSSSSSTLVARTCASLIAWKSTSDSDSFRFNYKWAHFFNLPPLFLTRCEDM